MAAELDTATRAHLLHLYGSLAVEVLAPAGDDPSLLEPLVPGRPDLRAQELYARSARVGPDGRGRARRRTTAWLGQLSRSVARRPQPDEAVLESGHVTALCQADTAARARRWRAQGSKLGRGARPRRGRLPEGTTRARKRASSAARRRRTSSTTPRKSSPASSCTPTTSIAVTEPDTRPASSVWRRCSVQAAVRAPTRRPETRT